MTVTEFYVQKFFEAIWSIRNVIQCPATKIGMILLIMFILGLLFVGKIKICHMINKMYIINVITIHVR